jgi:hypothetical protein
MYVRSDARESNVAAPGRPMSQFRRFRPRNPTRVQHLDSYDEFTMTAVVRTHRLGASGDAAGNPAQASICSSRLDGAERRQFKTSKVQ